MAVGKARGNSRLVGRSRELRQEDVNLLEALIAILPSVKVREVVAVCLRRLVGEDLGAAVALPMFMGTMEKALESGMREIMTGVGAERFEVLGTGEAGAGGLTLGYAGGDESTLSRWAETSGSARWVGRLRSAVEHQTATSEPADEFLDQEADMARREIVRDWLNAVQLAWQAWGVSSGKLRLRPGDLEPEAPDAPNEAYDSWRQVREEARASLLASLALDEEGLDALTLSFASSMRPRCARGAGIALPGGLRVARSDGGFVVERQASGNHAEAPRDARA